MSAAHTTGMNSPITQKIVEAFTMPRTMTIHWGPKGLLITTSPRPVDAAEFKLLKGRLK